MSVYLQSTVSDLDLTAVAVVYSKPSGWAVASIPVQTLIDEEQAVILNPVINPSTPHPCDLAHALVDGIKQPKSRREHISRASPLVYVVP
jgi:hypothetical protein